ncbi:hypothetical protein E3N88_34920 [Mikania micrantha]|uniref:Uncharacterized protein n=1 Tax=Mikania micrantha TaxID=192012 RepID=A0A5N6LZI4_9ASTR|nr:hypothetical protein E3N88_34920 [Mikania micrantha]
MMNVGENRVQNGVLDCPEMKNEENFLSIEQLGSSRYAKDGLKVLGDTRWNKISEILRISSRYAKLGFAPFRGIVFTSSDRCSTVKTPSD